MSIEVIESKYPLIFGGFTGFFLVMVMGWNSGMDIMTLITRASIGCVVGALLMKIFVFVLEMSIRSATIEKERQRNQEEESVQKEQ